MWHYVAMGRYSQQLAPFIDAFGRERVMVLDYDELVRDPQVVLDRCFAFIGVDEIELSGLALDINAGGQPRSEMALRVMKAARAIEPVRRAVRKTVPFGIRERIRNSNLRTDAIDPEVRTELDAVFAPELDALSSLLGPDAPAWATTR
jgi:hypothetical protein